MKRAILCVLCILLLFSSSACSAPQQESRTFFALDTYCVLTVWGADESVLEKAETHLRQYESLWNVAHQESIISRLNAGENVELDEKTKELLSLSQKFYWETGGAFDITVAPLVEAYGFYSDEYRVPGEDELSRLLPLVDGAHLFQNGQLSLREGQKIDFGAIAKGYIADKLADFLMDQGAVGAVVSLGGNVCVRGQKADGSAFTVAVTDPEKNENYLGTMSFFEGSLVTAGAYQRNFTIDGVEYHHILDPKTGTPASSDLLSATVLCRDGARADALATACFVLGKDEAIDLWRAQKDFELILVTRQGNLFCTEGLSGQFSATERTVEIVKKNG